MRNHIPIFFYTRSAPSLTKRAVYQLLTLHKWNLAFWPKKIRPSKTIPPARISAPLPKQLSLSSTRGSLQPRLSRLFHHSVSDFFEHDHHPASSSSSFHHHGAQHSSIILSLTPLKQEIAHLDVYLHGYTQIRDRGGGWAMCPPLPPWSK